MLLKNLEVKCQKRWARKVASGVQLKGERSKLSWVAMEDRKGRRESAKKQISLDCGRNCEGQSWMKSLCWGGMSKCYIKFIHIVNTIDTLYFHDGEASLRTVGSKNHKLPQAEDRNSRTSLNITEKDCTITKAIFYFSTCRLFLFFRHKY